MSGIVEQYVNSTEAVSYCRLAILTSMSAVFSEQSHLDCLCVTATYSLQDLHSSVNIEVLV